MYFLGVGLNETKINLEHTFYLLKKNWKYGGSVCDTEVARGAQTE